MEYQCTVTGSPPLILTWRIRNETSDLGSNTYTSLGITNPTTLAGFSVEQLSTNPLVSNISFIVQSSINGYTIVCEEGGDNENCTINIAGTIITATSAYATVILVTVNYRALYISTECKITSCIMSVACSIAQRSFEHFISHIITVCMQTSHPNNIIAKN